MTASHFLLERRIDLFAITDINPVNNTEYRIERIVSYDSGETWVDNWVMNETASFASPPAVTGTGDSLDIFLAARGKDGKIYFSRLSEYFEFRNKAWGPIGNGVFEGKPALCLYGNSVTKW